MFDDGDFNSVTSLDEIFRKKFVYNEGQCPKCCYTIDGILLNEYNLISIVFDLYFPNVLFICIKSINWDSLYNNKLKIKNLFNDKIEIMKRKYDLLDMKCITYANYFSQLFTIIIEHLILSLLIIKIIIMIVLNIQKKFVKYMNRYQII